MAEEDTDLREPLDIDDGELPYYDPTFKRKSDLCFNSCPRRVELAWMQEPSTPNFDSPYATYRDQVYDAITTNHG